MKNRIISKAMSIVLILATIISCIPLSTNVVYAAMQDEVLEVNESTQILLENGDSVTEDEFLELLLAYEGEVFQIEDASLETIASNSVLNDDIVDRSASSIPLDDVAKLMAGTWYIPGIGKIVVVGGAIIIGGVAIYKVTGWVATQVKNWLTSRAIDKQATRAVRELGGVNSNKANHILATKHKWSSLEPGGPRDPNRWERIKAIIKEVMKKGTESRYGSAYKKTLNYRGKVVEVTYQKLKDGVVKISNAWVK